MGSYKGRYYPMSRRYWPLACGHGSYATFEFSWGSTGCMECARERHEERQRTTPVSDDVVAEAMLDAFPLDDA